jgi:hypothetical protein
MPALKAGWDTIILSAARLKLPVSAKAVKKRNCRSDMAWVRVAGRAGGAIRVSDMTAFGEENGPRSGYKATL